MVEVVDTKFVVISDDIPIMPDNWEPYFTWLQPTTGKWHSWNGSGWDVISAPLIAVPSKLGNTDFIGTVSADGDQGLTGQRTIQGYTLTFKKGLLTGFQAP
uniref:Uncharacterized protein n=1 Tax=viral metagenome TaxID=1070528 RepID=A0A6H1ZFC4_9ZZZZ